MLALKGVLGEADTVESFEFQRMTVRPRTALGRRSVKAALNRSHPVTMRRNRKLRE